jgi:phage-related minor tail protein
MFANIAASLMQELVITQMIAMIKGTFGGSPVAAAANGAVFGKNGVMAFADGGVVNRATMFPMSGGGIGLMGEAGPEAVMPLNRGSDGKLGVKAEQPEVKVNIVNVTDRNEIANVLASPEGSKVIMNTLKRNRQTARSIVG